MNFIDKYFSNLDAKIISGLTNELKYMYIYNKFNKENSNYLIVCNSLFEANKIYEGLKNYTEEILFFPMDDFITSQVLAISPDFKLSRLETINQLRGSKKIVVTNLMGYLRFLLKPKLFYDNYINLEKNEEHNIKKLVEELYKIGYTRETIVNKSGEMAVRGYIVDIFPINYNDPIRIEFWGDVIDSIRSFDINSQLTIKEIQSVQIICNNEFITNESTEEKQQDLNENNLIYTINDYMGEPLVVYNDFDDIKISYNNLQSKICDYAMSNNLDLKKQYMKEFESIRLKKSLDLCKFNSNNSISYESYKIESEIFKISDLSNNLDNYLKKYHSVILCVSNRYQANKIIDILDDKVVFTDENNILSNKINIILKKITEGFIFNGYVFISEQEIFGSTKSYKKYKSNFKFGTRIKDITKINIGDYVVHSIYGIGRYCGIKTISKNGLLKDYLQIEYKDNDKLYVPVEKIDLINKYSSNDEYVPKINKLGSSEWEKIKLKAKKRASFIANELLNLYALRETKKGFIYNKDDEDQLEFEKEFPYTPTESQIKVMEEIKEDMESPHPMDRLLCGDVGYGKTELAFRAAFKAILSGKQVILLCPTTILSNQHYQNAIERFKSFPVNISLLNRFTTPKETKNILEGLEKGSIDFVIGTHKLLNDDIKYKNLGLLVVDEEQRFGVIHKEKIKKYRNNIDVLTLSATPIPRTLQMSMSGIRSLSLLEVPPNDRYPIQTYVVAYDQKVIKDAIYKELSRSGQVFLLYNHVNNIEIKAKEIETLVPEARVASAHGRMPKTKLENIMMDFVNYEYDVLVCTTIIETGIDIPNVNTLIVMDADYFGLSQLYQLRGRVGRSNKIAYCYLMYNNSKILSEIATKRLNAIKEFTELGSGLAIARRDLSLRGAGDMLGSEQAGFIDSVGIDLFTKMLKDEINKLKGIVVEEEEKSQPLLDVNTYVDDNYIDDEDLKIEIHKMINEIDSYKKLLEVKTKIEDRFGKVNEKLIIYMYEEWFETMAKKLRVKRVKQTNNEVEIFFDKEITNKIDGEKLFVDAYNISHNFSFKISFGFLDIKLSLKNLEKDYIYYLVELMQLIEKII